MSSAVAPSFTLHGLTTTRGASLKPREAVDGVGGEAVARVEAGRAALAREGRAVLRERGSPLLFEHAPLPAVHLPATTFNKIHKTLEAIQDSGGKIFLGVQASIQKHQDSLKLFRISEE